jgi:peptidyl-prolyl cis-trans isomerase D
LKPAADDLKLSVQNTGWIGRSGKNSNKLLNSPKLMQAVFSEDVLKNKRNTEVVDVGDNTLVAARVVDYKAASARPFDEVSAEIGKRLAQEQAAQMASKQGREMLAKLKQGADVPGVCWDTGKLVSRENAAGYASAALAAVFKSDVTALPAYTGVENPQGGYVLLRITRVVENDPGDAAKRKAVTEELQRLAGQEELNAYIASLKLKSDVTVHKDRLENKQP